MEAEEKALRAYIDTWYEDFPEGDADRMAAHYTADARLYLANLPGMRGRDAAGSLLAQMAAALGMDIDYKVTDVDMLTDDFAVVTGEALSKSTPKAGGDVIKDASRFVMVMERKDGKWMSRYDISQPTPDVAFKD